MVGDGFWFPCSLLREKKSKHWTLCCKPMLGGYLISLNKILRIERLAVPVMSKHWKTCWFSRKNWERNSGFMRVGVINYFWEPWLYIKTRQFDVLKARLWTLRNRTDAQQQAWFDVVPITRPTWVITHNPIQTFHALSCTLLLRQHCTYIIQSRRYCFFSRSATVPCKIPSLSLISLFGCCLCMAFSCRASIWVRLWFFPPN